MNQRSRLWIVRTATGLGAAASIYLCSYVVNSSLGGYWLQPQRDGMTSELFGVHLTTAFLWQPMWGHSADGHTDFLGLLFSPAIRADRRWWHRTRYARDDLKAWFEQLPVSDIHPRFREEFEVLRDRMP